MKIGQIPDEALRQNIEAQQKVDASQLSVDQRRGDDVETRWQALRVMEHARNMRAADPVSGLSAVSQALLDERAKVQRALERITQWAPTTAWAEAVTVLADVEIILRGAVSEGERG